MFWIPLEGFYANDRTRRRSQWSRCVMYVVVLHFFQCGDYKFPPIDALYSLAGCIRVISGQKSQYFHEVIGGNLFTTFESLEVHTKDMILIGSFIP